MTDEKSKLSEMIKSLLDHWDLTSQQSLDLLQISSFSELDLWSNSNFDIPELSHRVEKTLQIHASLRMLFPGDIDLAYAWINNKNRAFGKSPLKHIIENRESGLEEVATYLKNQCFS